MTTEFTVPTEKVYEALERFPTPFHIYDVATMRRSSEQLYHAMKSSAVPGFRNFYAVKALPNPHVLKQLVEMGHGLDCSSLAELELARQIGVRGDSIMFTSNNTSLAEFEAAHAMNAIINFDDVSHVKMYLDEIGIPRVACCRYNPGDEFVNSEENTNMLRGTPSEQKYGMSRGALKTSFSLLASAGVTTFGLHTMLLSNNSSWENHARVAEIMFGLTREIASELSMSFDFVNLGGGIGVQYSPDDTQFDYERFAQAVKSAYETAGLNECGSPRIVMENGRAITAPAGWLVCEVQTLKSSYKDFVGVDASMADLMRPGMYGAYHHVSLLGDVSDRPATIVDVVGSLCENNDKFAVDRRLPSCAIGDIIVIHTTGAHGHAMGFNYNGRLRSAELLIEEDGSIRKIRRAETLDDLFATIVPMEDAA